VIEIRRACVDDLPAILRIETKSFDRDAWDRELFLDYLNRPARSVFLVAAINRKVVGYALAFHSETRAEIHSIAVAPAQRGQGVAAALLRRIIALLRRRGFETVSLNVRLENEAAIRLYRKLGFQRVRRVNGYYEDGAPAWRMRRSRSPS
jgi:[ribosomal protein S18]-alanine N-acetyltransferase